VRMERHEQSARRVAEWLSQQPAVRRLNYPGLPSHPQHELAKRQAKAFGALISFDLAATPRRRRSSTS